MEYPRLGYLPEAMLNFLSLLGWSPGTDEELFTRDELVARFTLEGIGGGNAVFNAEKLDWFNQQHILRLPDDELANRIEPVLKEQGLWSEDFKGARRAWFLGLLNLYKARLKKLTQFAEEARPLLTEPITFDPDAVKKHLSKPGLHEALLELAGAFESLQPFAAAGLEERLRSIAAARQIKAAALIHATRVAVTGRANSPGLFEVLELAGRARVVHRIRASEPFLLPSHPSESA
jgi:glutamyl/glutaminyl-tRNA synthetase